MFANPVICKYSYEQHMQQGAATDEAKRVCCAADCNSQICRDGACVRRVAPGQWCTTRKGLPRLLCVPH